MAEDQQQFQERTEQPTAKRLKDARRRGQTPRSRELTMTIVMISGAALLYLTGGGIVRSLNEIIVSSLSVDVRPLLEGNAFLLPFAEAGISAVLALTPLFVVLAIAAVAGGSVIGGWAFSTEVLAPKFSKLNPLTGLKRVFGVHGLVEMLKAIGKAVVVGLCAFGVFYAVASQVLALGTATLPSSLASAGQILAMTFVVCSASLAVIALADVPYQIFSHRKKLRMTRKEIRDELKETEGAPEVKFRLRSMQQQLSSRRMLEKVPEADVVVSNPTHFAVALKYDDRTMSAPIVVAAGIDYLALRIRDIARASRVPVLESPILARSLYATASLNREIDPRLYVAVAQVLTWVFQLRAAGNRHAATPDLPDVEISEELRELARRVTVAASGDA